jgi:hypothetical protein
MLPIIFFLVDSPASMRIEKEKKMMRKGRWEKKKRGGKKKFLHFNFPPPPHFSLPPKLSILIPFSLP